MPPRKPAASKVFGKNSPAGVPACHSEALFVLRSGASRKSVGSAARLLAPRPRCGLFSDLAFSVVTLIAYAGY